MEDERASGWQRRAEESKLSDGGWVGSGNGERNKKELAGTKRKPRLWGVVVVNPHPRVRSATTLPPVLSLSAPLPPSQPLVLFPSSSGSRLLWRLPSSSVYISSFLKFLNIRSIGSRSLGKNWVGRHEMSAVGTAVSPSPPGLHPPSFSFRPQDPSALFQRRFIRISSQNAATDAPTRLRINYSISARRSALRFCMLKCDRENNFALMVIT